MAFYRNKGDGTFEDRTEAAGVTDQLGGLVCVQTDYNNDGRLDIFIPRGAWLPHADAAHACCATTATARFTDVTEEAGLLDPVNSNAAAWADYDNDGWLDLFVGCETPAQPPVSQPGRRHLRGGRRQGRRRSGDAERFCKGCAWLDFDNDDYPDLFVNNLDGDAPAVSQQSRRHLHRRHRRRWASTGPRTASPAGPGTTTTTAGSTSSPPATTARSPTWSRACWASRTAGIPTGSSATCSGKGFEDMTKEAGLDMVFATMGSNFGDFDNDGFLDMYLGTGDPTFGHPGPQPDVQERRRQAVRRDHRRPRGTGHLQKGHGVACGDWDRDGDVDLFIEMGGAVNGDKYHNILFQNPGQGNHWLTVKLVGKKTNRAAIGARIKVVTAGEKPLTVHRHVSSGSSFGANPLQQTIGLAKADRVALLEIHWPTSGTTQVFRDIAADQAIEVTEFAETYRPLDWKPIPQPK